jgi:excisionase family DNA binding protein
VGSKNYIRARPQAATACLIADVTLKSGPHRPDVRVSIRWQSTEEHVLIRPPKVTKPTPFQALELLRRLAPHYSNADITAELNAAGLHTGTGRVFDELAISRLRTDHHLPPQPLLRDGELSAKQVADRLGISPGAVYYWISHGQLEARRSHGNRLCIPFPSEVEHQCRRRVANSTQMPAQAQNHTHRCSLMRSSQRSRTRVGRKRTVRWS